jgi:hypothetical protein
MDGGDHSEVILVVRVAIEEVKSQSGIGISLANYVRA